MALEGVRRDEIPSPEDRLPSPGMKYSRHLSDSELSPVDTPRKNKRKLNEPKRRTSDFSIKRFCPDSPGSACSESGRSEESTPEHIRNETPESPVCEDFYNGTTTDRDGIHPPFRHPFMIPGIRHQPYFIPQFYYNGLSGLPSGETVPMGINGINRVPKMNPLKVPSIPYRNGLKIPSVSHYDSGLNVSAATEGSKGLKLPTVPHSGSGLKIPDLNVLHSQTTSTSQSHGNKHSHEHSRLSPESQNTSPRSARDIDNESPDSSKDRKSRKNYKNMTRERRVEANARERSRVHTISAAFEGLRRAVPSYSYNQKLSKLAILRIACTYINALTKLAELDDSPSPQNTSFADCVDNCTRTIQTEGKARRRH